MSIPTLPAEPPVMPVAPETPQPPKRRRRRLKQVFMGVVYFFALVGVISTVVIGWALNRYVFDHVEIGDVAAYEASLASAPSTTTGGAAATTVAGRASSAPVVSDTSYQSDALSIDISKVVVGAGAQQVTYFVADVVVQDSTALRGGFAQNKFGRNIIEDPSDIAADVGAIFAINGDYYGYRTSGIVIRNGVLYRDEGARLGLAMYRDGTMAVYDERTTTGAELVAAGVWNTVSFGPALLDDGEIVAGIDNVEVDTNIGNHTIQGYQPRTGLGMIAKNHFVFVVVDGRSSGYSRGVTMTQFAQIFKGLGATVAYNLDGGGSATMVFNGKLVNNPLGKGNERGTSDILYLA